MGKISAKGYKTCGSRSSFFIINRRKGFKTFATKREAELARSYQVILADRGYAPRVCSEVGKIAVGSDVITNKPILSEWGYIVQKVRTLGCSDSAGGCDCERCDAARYDYEAEIEDMCTYAQEQTGLIIGDRHIGNFGILDGSIVVLDTGIETFGEY